MTRLSMTALLVAALSGCGGNGNNPGGVGGGTAAAGGGGGGFTGGVGGGITGGTGGGTGTAGGTGGSGGPTFTLSGTLNAPAGGNVQSTVVIGCAWINDDCDENKSVGVQLSATGASGAWELTGLERGLNYFVIFWKDMNGTQMVDDGDYVGVVTDASGNVRVFTEAAASVSAQMNVKQTAAQTTVPSMLVGNWFLVNTNIGVTNSWIFDANGVSKNEFTLNSVACSGAGTAITANGVASVSGNSLTFTPSNSNKNVIDCSGVSTVTAYYTNVRHFTWRVGASTKQSGGTALFLTPTDVADPTEAEFQKL